MSGLCVNSGQARLHVASVAGHSVVVGAQARSPLRLLTPRASGGSVWAYTSSFGGGMVAGDRTRLEVTIQARSRCFLGTQASTKIYRNPNRLPCSHELEASILEDALLILAPDPVQCFAHSSYEQRQHFLLAPTASLLLIDWISSGRTARGERWGFRRYLSRNEVVRMERDTPAAAQLDQPGQSPKRASRQKLLLDSLLLDSGDGPLDSAFRGGRFNCLATVALFGPQLSRHAKQILEWANAQTIEPKSNLLFAASPLHDGALIRLAGASVEETGRAIHERLGFVRDLLDDDPWSRKW